MSEQVYGKAYAGTGPENYERYFVPAIGAPLAKDLIEVAALREGERVLDVACGTGVVARLASERVGADGSVTGLDVNPGMLAVASSNAPPGTSIEWHEASAEAMPLPDETFDVVLCQMGLQFVPDRRAALGEMRRVLASGGRVVLNLPGPTPRALALMGEALTRHIGAKAAGFVSHVFSLHDTEEVLELIDGAGFRDGDVRAETKQLSVPAPKEFLWQYVQSTPMAAVVAQVGEEQRAALERDVVAKWQQFVTEGGMTLEVRMLTATARR